MFWWYGSFHWRRTAPRRAPGSRPRSCPLVCFDDAPEARLIEVEARLHERELLLAFDSAYEIERMVVIDDLDSSCRQSPVVAHRHGEVVAVDADPAPTSFPGVVEHPCAGGVGEHLLFGSSTRHAPPPNGPQPGKRRWGRRRAGARRTRNDAPSEARYPPDRAFRSRCTPCLSR